MPSSMGQATQAIQSISMLRIYHYPTCDFHYLSKVKPQIDSDSLSSLFQRINLRLLEQSLDLGVTKESRACSEPS